MQWPVKVTLSCIVFYLGHCLIYVASEVLVECPASIFKARGSVCSFETLMSIYKKTRCQSHKTKIRNFSTFEITKSHKFKFLCQMFTADVGTMEAHGDCLSLDGNADVTTSWAI